MGSESLTTFGDIANFTPKRTISKGSTAPFFSMADIAEHNKFVLSVGEKEFSGGGSKFKNGDILFARITPCLQNGKLAKVSHLKADEVGHGSTEFIVIEAKDKCDSEFIYYLCRSNEFKAYAESRMEGSTGRQRVSWQALSEYEFDFPAATHRQKTGQILAQIDNKIALNRQINQTLEQMAQALFKSWFIDFDPVIDNAIAAGNPVPEPFKARAAIRQKIQQTGEFKPLDKDTLALFPAEFEQSELGWVPKGWKSESLYNLAEYVNGAAYKKFEPNERKEGLPIIKIAELKSGISEKTSYSVIQMPIKYLLANKDILFSWSGNPDTSIDTFVWSLGSAWLNQHIFKVIPKKSIGYSFILQTLKYMKPIFSNIARDKQTTGLGHVTVKDLKRLHIPIPQEAILTYFETTLSATIERAFGNQISIQTLTALRDTLLPKLISGELKLPDNL